MMTMNFGIAVLVLVNFWLIALTAFGTATAAIFLYILNGVTAAINASTALSLVCSALTVIYLVIQSVNVAHIKRSHRQESWLNPACVHLPRVLIACWVPAAAIGLWSTLRQPECRIHTTMADAESWQSSLSCWVFRVMVSSTVIMTVLVLSNLIVLEINDRCIPIGLFHFEHTNKRGFEHTRRFRKPILINSHYDTSITSLASPSTIVSEDELQLTSSAEKLRARNAYPISPSPTYRTLDLSVVRSRAPSLPSQSLSRPQDEEYSIDLPTSRNSTSTTLTLSSFPATPTSAATYAPIFASSQLAARPFSASDLPAVPTSFQRQIQELEAIKHNSMNNASKYVRPALYVTNRKIRSSSAIPLTGMNENDFRLCGTDPTVEKTRSASLADIIEKPAPAWFSDTKLKSMPLSADPAIKKLTGLRRNSKLGISFDRTSRRISLSGFEFGFASSTPATKTDSKVTDEEADGQNLKFLYPSNQHARAKVARNDVQTLQTAAKPCEDTNEVHREETVPPTKTMERKHPVRGGGSGQLKRPGKTLSIMPPPMPRAAGHICGQSASGQGRERGKSMVERGRYEKLSR